MIQETRYNNLSFYKYLKLHKSTIHTNFLNFGWLFTAGAILMMFTNPFSFSSTFFYFFFIFWSFVVLNGSLLLSYKNYKKRYIQFSKIEPFIISSNYNVQVELIRDKPISKMDLFNHYGESPMNFGNSVDVFRTKDSIFLFPMKNEYFSDVKWPKIIEIDYFIATRFPNNINEKLTFNETNTVRKFSVNKINENTEITFKDKKFNSRIRLILKNFT